MSSVLIIGTGPLFAPDVRVFNGQALRTWHLTSPMLDAGHRVDLIVLPVEDPGRNTDPDTVLTTCQNGAFEYRLVSTNDDLTILRAIQKVLDEGHYDCLIAVNNNAAAIVCRLATQLPIWVDLNGAIMGEAQTKCRVYGDDAFLRHFWDIERIALRRADRFSAVSYKQMYATIGELGSIGRLNQYTFSHPFLTVIPNAAYEQFLNPACYPTRRKYRGNVFPEDAFAVLWSGGFNTWTDTRTLVGALSLSMEVDPRIHLVTTGGTIYGHDERTYEAFLVHLEQTGFLERCHLLGWVEARELFSLYRECDLGISVDSLNYETLLGARNRLTNMMAADLPILTTLGTEITEILNENKLGYVVPIGGVQEMADALVRAARNPVERRSLAERARKYCLEHFTYESTTRSLLRWVDTPCLAPDNEEKLNRFPQERMLQNVALNPLEQEAMLSAAHEIEDLLHCRDDLERIRGKKLFRLYKAFFS